MIATQIIRIMFLYGRIIHIKFDTRLSLSVSCELDLTSLVSPGEGCLVACLANHFKGERMVPVKLSSGALSLCSACSVRKQF